MLGHLKTSPCELSTQANKNYWLSYCSLCDSLRSHNKLPYSLLLSNEMTLLLMAFEFYSIDIATTTTRCPAKLFLQTKPIHTHEVTKLAGELSIVLAWIKIIDSTTDKPSLFKKAVLRILTKKVRKITSLSTRLQEELQTYIALVKKNESNFDTMQHHSGMLAHHIALEIGHKTNAPLDFITYQANTFQLLGELIGLADHLIDFSNDLYQQQYNPIIDLAKINQSSFLEEYTKLFDRFCYQRNVVMLRMKEHTSPFFAETFAEALQKALQKLSKKIDQAAPTFIKEKEPILRHRFIIQRADSDCGGCDCGDCSCCDSSCCSDFCSDFCADYCCNCSKKCWNSCDCNCGGSEQKKEKKKDNLLSKLNNGNITEF